MPRPLVLLWLALLAPYLTFSQMETPATKLLEKVEGYPDTACSTDPEAIILNHKAKSTDTFRAPGSWQGCYWVKYTFQNPEAVSRTRVLYFPKGWQTLECYLPLSDSAYEKVEIGINNNREVLPLEIPPGGRQELYVRYPEPTKAYRPILDVREMTEETYLRLRSRTKLKFLLIGVLVFPILFFLVQFLVQKDRLSFFYLLFLVGASAHLLTILDTIPFFELSPKIIPSMGVIKRLFVLSTLITLAGLVKYIHVFLYVSSWSRVLFQTGNLILGAFLAIVLIPLIYPPIFQNEAYVHYLPYFRVWALLTFLYVFLLCIWAMFRKIDFSLLLFLAFSPLVISGLIYASSFILAKGFIWLSLESLILITGFMFTLLLFGVVLGVRNNAIKAAKIRLEQQAKQLRELSQFKSRFYTNITHEFRTPLTVIKGMAEQINGQEKVKTLIQRNGIRLLNMVNQLLELSRLERNSLAIHWVQGDVIPYLQYLVESCHSLANNKRINLAFFSKEESLVMDYDEIKLQQILINLVSNAIKFTPEYGSVKVIAAQVPENGVPYLKLTISDTGKGIPEDKLPHIFNRFYQVDNSATRQGEGSGIGLSLVKELVQLLEGDIKVDSEEGKGTTFVVMLPITKEADTIDARDTVGGGTEQRPAQAVDTMDTEYSMDIIAPSPMHESTDTTMHKPSLLIIEDNADVTEYIVSCLDKDYALQTARNGREGVEKALESIPDVILSDVMMPEMDGFEVCRVLKSDRRSSHIPIVLLTAKAAQEDKVAGLSQGADAYLTKPFDKEELLARLNNLAAISQRLRERLSTPPAQREHPGAEELREAAFLKELHEIIETNMSDESFDTNRLCRAIAMSRTQLHRKLKALTGQATASYIRSSRLQKAKALLESTDMPIGEIAIRVGYKDFSHFSRSFAKEFGILPSEVRK